MSKKIVCFVVFVCLVVPALADRPLDRTEVVDVFKSLTDQPRRSWISTGTILANHEEYRAAKTTDAARITEEIKKDVDAYVANPKKRELKEQHIKMMLDAIPFNTRYELSNEYTMKSTVTIKYDGNRFYWEIIVNSREDSVLPPVDLATNSFAHQFRLDWNQKRVFAWDNEKYTTYFLPGNYAMVTGSPSGVNGPLTAGVIAWGYNRYGYESLCEAESSAVKIESLIHLNLEKDQISETFVLDPQKDYAIQSYSVNIADNLMEVRKYDDYQLSGSHWCPGRIIMEQFDLTTNPARLTGRDVWDFTSVSNGTVEAKSFNVNYEYDALIEDYRFGDHPLQYRYLPPEAPSARNIDLEELTESRLEIARLAEPASQNCATVSLKYVCRRLGINPSWEDLSRLVNSDKKSSALSEIQRFAWELGLTGVAVKTDVETLKTLGECEVILHLPGYDHYVVMAGIGHEYIRLLDLSQDNFLYRTEIGTFEGIWEGTALLVANKPISLYGNVSPVEEKLWSVFGASVCHDCNDVLQQYYYKGCTMENPPCDIANKYPRRLGCNSLPGAAPCKENPLPKLLVSNCEGFVCEPDGDWKTEEYMLSCGGDE